MRQLAQSHTVASAPDKSCCSYCEEWPHHKRYLIAAAHHKQSRAGNDADAHHKNDPCYKPGPLGAPQGYRGKYSRLDAA
jgi:hypothetical protein